MSRSKLERYRQNRDSDLVLEHTDFASGRDRPAGRWHRIFGVERPLTVELACGRGEYAVALAENAPERSFVGVDIKGARLWAGVRAVKETGLTNVRFLRIYIEHLSEYFGRGEIDEIWLTFPDPFPRSRQEKKRLTSPRFLQIYRQVLNPEGVIHLKTDSRLLYDYTLETLASETGWRVRRKLEDIDAVEEEDELKIRTRFEERHRHKGTPIKYICFAPYWK